MYSFSIQPIRMSLQEIHLLDNSPYCLLMLQLIVIGLSQVFMDQMKVSCKKEDLVPLSLQRLSRPGLTPTAGQNLWVRKNSSSGMKLSIS